MAKIDLKFLDNSTPNCTIQVFKIDSHEIEIIIHEVGVVNATIFLDKSTAIKFAKTLRTEINKIEN
mgnify:CR=1 FL=1